MRILKGCLALVTLLLNTVVHAVVVCLLAIPKLLAPTKSLRDEMRKLLARVAESWISVNSLGLSLYGQTDWDLELPNGLNHKGSYVVCCNHQSWVDIPVLQRCFNRRLPLLLFFIKSQLIWVPFLGLAWWALDFPFMKRLSKEQLAQNPHLKGKDLESARTACEKFQHIPVAMMNFPEGTRFSASKRDDRRSPYQHLLAPRIGGIGQVLYALSDKLDGMIDVTIVYQDCEGNGFQATLWDLVSGQVPRICVRARVLPIPQDLIGTDFGSDVEARQRLSGWMSRIWAEKDGQIARLGRHHARIAPNQTD